MTKSLLIALLVFACVMAKKEVARRATDGQLLAQAAATIRESVSLPSGVSTTNELANIPYGGERWDMFTQFVEPMMNQGFTPYIESIAIEHLDPVFNYFCGLTINYRFDKSGVESQRVVASTKSTYQNGCQPYSYTLAKGEFFTTMKMETINSDWPARLFFSTNLKQDAYIVGKPGTTSLTANVPSGQQIISLFGGQSDILSSWGAYLMPYNGEAPAPAPAPEPAPAPAPAPKVHPWPAWSNGECVDYDEYYYAKNCKDILNEGHKTNGIYTIFKDDGTSLEVYCEMTIDNGGWTQLLNKSRSQSLGTPAKFEIDDQDIKYKQVLFITCKNHRFSYNKDKWPYESSKGYNSVLNYLQFSGSQYMVRGPVELPQTPNPTYISSSSFVRLGPVPTICYIGDKNTPGNCFYQFIAPAPGELQEFGDRRSLTLESIYTTRFDYDFQIYVR